MRQVDAQTLSNAYWNEGENLVTLGARYGKAPGTIHHWFKKFGIHTRSCTEAKPLQARSVTPAETQQMVQLYESGLSSNDVAERLGRDGRLVRTHLETAGVLRSHTESADLAVRSGKILTTALNTQFFKTVTPVSAWVLGLIFGDGHVQISKGHSYGVHLAGTQQVLKAVAALLKHNRPPKCIKQNGKELNVWKLAWYSKEMVEDLAKFGLTGGNKAHTMKWPEGLSEEFLPHFVRGLWDSDGSWARYALKSGEHSLCATYTSASDEFIQGLKTILEDKGWAPRVKHYFTELNGKTFSCNRLRLLATHSRDLARWIYANTTSELRCGRKFGIAI